ncbi:MAG: MerR family transcriptional regulator [Candidatus Omnitrophota bacterium]
MKRDNNARVFTIGITAKMLGVCPATLRIWERKKLIKPARIGKNRFYSQCDIDKLDHIKSLLQKNHINIEGVKKILETKSCWQIKKCKPKERKACSVYLKYGRS